MDSAQVLELVLKSFERYYTIYKEDIISPFSALAEFHSHTEQYMFIKAAKISDIDSNDYAYFKITDSVSEQELRELAEKAWSDGLSKVKPYNGHRNSDVTLVIVADKIEETIPKIIRKIKYSKSYKFTLYGWSNFRLVVKELSSNKVYSNRLGSDLKKILTNIKNF